MTIQFRDLFSRPAIIPVLQIDRREDAVPLAQALINGGLSVLEVTLRTEAAVDAAAAIKAAFPEATVGLGTVTEKSDFDLAHGISADFMVSPGFAPELAATARQCGLPYMPGAATVSEVMAARALGFIDLKFFPSALSGGVKMLQSLAPLFPDVLFCPTGGVGFAELPNYLDQPNVFAVGGSWIAPRT